MDVHLPTALAETSRFEVRDYLGSGGFGVVWAVDDRERGARVALKWLKQGDASMIARFKREFRALSDLGHPNLVEFRDLLTVGEEWFFTMELIDGIDLLSFVRPASAPAKASEAASSTASLVPFGSELGLAPANGANAALAPGGGRYDPRPGPSLVPRSLDPNRPLCVADLARVRVTLEQLAAGLSALHGAGMLHRDIKPSNVLVTREGRVVLLDFGLVTELGEDGVAETVKGRVVGTPAYMSPEQALGMPVTPASDWYSVGAILYQALTGNLPYDGDPYDVLFRKQLADPPPPSEVVRGVPPALSELCMALLARAPEGRPVGAAFLERLRAALPIAGAGADGAEEGKPAESKKASDLVGREAHLWALEEALAEVESGKTVVALVHGRSGMGKSALVRTFLESVRRDRAEAVILEGRCYEREAVPYKALDSLADALCRYMTRLTDAEQAEITPRDLPLLAKLFPVFLQLKGATGKKARGSVDVVHERRRAFEALRELLQRLGDRRPLVLYIDDLQWGDADSEPALLSLLRGPEAPSLLFIAAYRSEDASSPLVRAMASVAHGEGVERCELPVGELSPEAARSLAEQLVAGRGDAALAETLARESCGSPLFLRQLAALGKDGEKIGLSEAVKKRVDALPEEPRRMLEVLAVSGRPLSLAVAALAAGVTADRDATFSALRRESLARSRPSEAKDEIEVYHDRIREVVAASLSPDDLAARHKALAHALASSGEADAETLAHHLSSAGDHELASSYAQKAAERAERTLAFERAARMYQMAMDLEGDLGRSGADLEQKLAEALACAGRGREAADRFLAVAARADGADALELRRRAAEQLLFSGHLDRGLRVIEDILTAMGMKARQSTFRTVLSLLWRRVALKFRGLGFVERRADQIARDVLVRVDTCASLARGLGLVDPFRGADFQTRFILLALEAGDPVRIAQSLTLEGAFRATEGSRALEAIQKLIARGSELAKRTGDAVAAGHAALMRGVASSLLADFSAGVEACDTAVNVLREKCVNVTWEIDNATFFACFSLFFQGRARELEKRLPPLVDDARSRGDLYSEVLLRVQVGWFLHFVKDDIPAAKAELRIVEERWSKERFLLQHAWKVLNGIDIALYEGDGKAALELSVDAEPRFKKALFLRAIFIRVRLLNGHGRAALALARTLERGAEQDTLLETVDRKARALHKESFPLARGFAWLLEAGAAHARGLDGRALELAKKALADLEPFGVIPYVAALQLWIAELLRDSRAGAARGTDEAEQLARKGQGALEAEGVRKPERFARVYAPGLGPPRL